jgi:hypothetical protein
MLMLLSFLIDFIGQFPFCSQVSFVHLEFFIWDFCNLMWNFGYFELCFQICDVNFSIFYKVVHFITWDFYYKKHGISSRPIIDLHVQSNFHEASLT